MTAYNDDEPFLVINEWDGVKILNAPKRTKISIELLSTDSAYIDVNAENETVTFCKTVTYKFGEFDTINKWFDLERVNPE